MILRVELVGSHARWKRPRLLPTEGATPQPPQVLFVQPVQALIAPPPAGGDASPLVYRKPGSSKELIIEKNVLKDHMIYSCAPERGLFRSFCVGTSLGSGCEGD
jgi:hypothetical protein